MLRPHVPSITQEVFDELNPSLVRHARRLVTRRDDADDLVQETWCSAMRSIASYRGESSLLTWLRRIMARRLADRLRKSRWVVELDEDTLDTDDERSALDDLSSARARAALTDALAQLPHPECTAVLLCDLQELERDEAAARLAVTRGHLRVILHRARRKLERILGEQETALLRCA
jgi:RNA polymerase sigma-70 factor (ECF subfamily)